MKSNKNIHYYWQLVLHLDRVRSSNQSGYAMLLTSVVSILIFSMLSVYLFSANLYKSVASSVVDSGTTFYAAETALNRRAYEVRQRFDNYGEPTGVSPTGSTAADQMKNCINSRLVSGAKTANDFECRMTATRYLESTVKAEGENKIVMQERNRSNNTFYRTYSFVNNLGQRVAQVPSGEPFAGLNMIENSYRVYTTAAKETDNGLPKAVSAQAMLQMDFNDRWIPLFQFAAFYQNDLEVTSSSNMTLTGPVHTNSNLRLSPGGLLTFQGRTTTAGEIYKSLGYTATHGGASRAVRVMGGNGFDVSPNNYSQFSVTGAWADATNNDKLSNAELLDTNNMFIQKTSVLTVPPIASTDRNGIFYKDADTKIDFDPNNPFIPGQAFSGQPFRVSTMGQILPDSMILSLRQPVLFTPRNTAAPAPEQNLVCQTSHPVTPGDLNPLYNTVSDTIRVPASANYTTLSNLYNTWLPAKRLALMDAMRSAIAQQTTPLQYSAVVGTNISALPTAFQSIFNNNTTGIGTATFTAAERTAISNVTMAQIAKLGGNCMLPAPMQVITNQLDRRELRNMTILQTNINSLSAWNRDGRHWNGSLASTDSQFFAHTAVNASANTPTGLTATDTTEGGLVWHFSLKTTTDPNVNANTYSYNNGTYAYQDKQSPFGFGFLGASRLPGPLSLVTDQAAYAQGNVNTTEKKPAALMADTITILSTTCLNGDGQFNCFNLNGATTVPLVNSGMTVNAAFLSRTDRTQITNGTVTRDSGGLNNYFRMLEDWTNFTFTYRGSFISMGEPLQASGRYLPGRNGNGITVSDPTSGGYYYYRIPVRDYGFDTSFNTVAGLPPLTPRVNYLKQKVFRRDYDTSDRS
jgi:hypothetical protein